jgi:nitrate reductase alpha subunit
LAKFQAILAEAGVQREAAEATNVELKDRAVAIKAEMESLGSYALEQAELIKVALEAADGAAKTHGDYVAWVGNER